MLPSIEKIKGLHPSIILKRELTLRNIKKTELARAIDEHKQTISAVLNQKRKITPQLSIKLGHFFNVEKDYFLILQASSDINKILSLEKKKTPNLDKIRRVLFWDTSFEKIDWEKHKKSVIKRVLERGNDTEINEIISFYGKKVVAQVAMTTNSFLSSFKDNSMKYNLI